MDSKTYMLLHSGWVQPFITYIGRLKAYETYAAAQRTTPAYAAFLKSHRHKGISRLSDWQKIPITNKENYVHKYSIEDRCQGGRIPARGVVIDESSGSSGLPNSWVRGVDEREDVKRTLQLSLGLTFKDKDFFFLNCFALGPWATGMNVSMSLVDVGIMKSIGPDKAKLENSLKLFGPNYHYIVTGYPPFIKNFVDTTEVDLKKYNLDLIVGGEAISEGLRTYLLQFFKSVRSSYGASDLEINIGAETDLAIDLRRKLLANQAACMELFGKPQPPMIFQYDPVDYIIEANAEGELIYTINRFHNAAPKIRYNLHDVGAVMTYKSLVQRLKPYGITLDGDYRHSHFPFLGIFGRGDLTVPFYGAKIFTSDIEKILNEDPLLVTAVNSFQMRSYDDQKLDRRLKISLEKTAGTTTKMHNAWLKEVIYDGLKANNQDFREVTKMFTLDSIEVEVFEYGKGPFEGRDARLKNTYIGTS